MSSISIIGLGGVARAIGARAIEGGNAVEVIGRDAVKAKDLAAALGGATAGTFGTTPVGDLVILAVPYASAVPLVAQYGDALADKVIVDISNTSNADATGLVTPDGTSGAQEIAKAVPASAYVVKAFNTVFGHILAQGGPLDVLFAGDDAEAKASVSAFIESLGWGGDGVWRAVSALPGGCWPIRRPTVAAQRTLYPGPATGPWPAPATRAHPACPWSRGSGTSRASRSSSTGRSSPPPFSAPGCAPRVVPDAPCTTTSWCTSRAQCPSSSSSRCRTPASTPTPSRPRSAPEMTVLRALKASCTDVDAV